MATLETYGLKFDPRTTQLEVELFFIKNNGHHQPKNKRYGEGLFHHFKAALTLCWPGDDHHRWTDLILKSYCENEISVFMGCSDSTKTWTMSKIVLIDYWCSPQNTLWAVSTTEGRGAELRFWGCIKDLFNQARERHQNLAGNPLDYLKCITSDSIEEDSARSLRRGIIVIPCKTGGVTSGLAPYIGIKAPRFRHAGDEVAVMNDSFLNAYANWYGKENFRGMMAGNFMETDDPLGVAAEPENGWDSWVDTGKTQEWIGKFYGAHVVALDGRDSPNLDYPVGLDGRQKFPYLIGPKKLDMIRRTKGTDSWEWYSQCVGKPVRGMDIWRVLSKDFCERHHASKEPVWNDLKTTQIYALDPAYGLGDRCVGRRLEFGKSVEGADIVVAYEPEIIPIRLNVGIEAEDQIAEYVVKRLDDLKIPYQNCAFDSFGRGTLGFSFSKLCGKNCPVPVDSGAKPTKRPVRFDLFVDEADVITGRLSKRLKRCDEEYQKFVTELWFSVREAIESEQVRGLDAETIREGCMRKFTRNGQGKKEVETKDEMKKRTSGRSPDLMDCFAIGIEMARRLGFKITRIMADEKDDAPKPNNWLSRSAKSFKKMMKARTIQEV